MLQTFLSYAREDADVVEHVRTDLTNAGLSTWIDANIPGGERWRRAIVDGIRNCDVFIIALSPASITSEHVRYELFLARSFEKRILPIMVTECLDKLHEYSATRDLLDLQIVDFAGSYQEGIEKLLDDLRTDSEDAPGVWGEAPEVFSFVGRTEETAQIEKHILDDQYRVVALLGMGGLGKSTLCSKVAEDVRGKYRYFIWVSLQDAPPVESIVLDCIRHFSDQQATDLPETLDLQITQLLTYLQRHRCLIVLDNFESVLQSGSQTGDYLSGYEGFGRLLRRIGESRHQSTLLITSREKPREIAFLERTVTSVWSIRLHGLRPEDAQLMLKDSQLVGTPDDWRALTELYDGNPLALKLIAPNIDTLFEGKIADFMSQGITVFGDILDILRQQFQRLSPAEADVMFWLAVEREPLAVQDLYMYTEPLLSRAELLDVLQSLHRRAMIERGAAGRPGFSLQPAVMEFVLRELLDRITTEIGTETIDLFASHALVRAQAKDFVRESQVRVIVQPLLDRLLSTLSPGALEQKLLRISDTLRKDPPVAPGYAGGNVANMLVRMHGHLNGYDFSRLSVQEVYLQGVYVQRSTFAQSDLTRCAFTKTFGSALSVAFSPDGQLLAVGTSGGNARVWQVQDAREILTCQGHTDWVTSVAFSPDGHILATGSEDQTLRLWDLENGHAFHTLMGHTNRVWCVTFNADGSLLASASDDGTVKLWDVSVGRCVATLQGHTNQVRAVSFSPDGKLLASGSLDETVRLWDVESRQCVKTMRGHAGRVWAVDFAANGRLLASGGDDQTVRLWETTSGKCVMVLQGHTGPVRSVALSPSGDIVASGSADQTVRLWDIVTGQCVKTLQGHTTLVRAVAFSPIGTVLASGSEDQTVRMWDTATGQCLRTVQGHTNEVWSLAFSPDGATFVSGGDDKAVRVWHIDQVESVTKFWGHESRIRSIAHSPRSSLVASGSDDRTVRLWNVLTDRCEHVLKGHQGRVRCVLFNPAGDIVVSSSEDQTIKLWDVRTGQVLRTLAGHTNWIRSIAISPDGQTIASGSDDRTLRLWRVDTGECIRTVEKPDAGIWAIAFSPDGQLLVGGGDDRLIHIRTVATLEEVAVLSGHTSPIWAVAFSPDGRRIGSSSSDETIRLWDVTTGECLHMLRGHTSPVRSFVFSPDGAHVASASEDETIRLWRVETGETERVFTSDKPYAGMNIVGVTGLTEPQIQALVALGAAVK